MSGAARYPPASEHRDEPGHTARPHRATQTFKDLPCPHSDCVFLSTCTEVTVPGLGAFSRQHKEFLIPLSILKRAFPFKPASAVDSLSQQALPAVCPCIKHLQVRRVQAWPVTPGPLQPLSKPDPAWFDMNQICQWLKTDTWAAESRENVARSIQLQSLINNSGREMPQYRAQQDLKIDHAQLQRNGGKQRGGRNGSTRGASSLGLLHTPTPAQVPF